MPGFVALLRGVNVGKAKRVPMAELRALFSRLGYKDVSTLLNSGNVIFRAGKSPSVRYAGEIASAISTGMSLDVPVIVKSAAEFAVVTNENPFAVAAEDHSRLLVAFTQEPGDLEGLAPLAALAAPPEEFTIRKNAAFLYCPRGVLKSRVGEALLGKAGRMVTTRNWATTLKLQTLLRERDA